MSFELQSATRAFLEQPHRLFIGGEWVPSVSGGELDTVNPATERVLARVNIADATDIDRAVAAARDAFAAGPWPAMGPAERSRLLADLADAIDAHRDVLMELEVLDNGMPLNPAASYAPDFCIKLLRYYSGWPGKLRGSVLTPDARADADRAAQTYTRREPVGVVGQITPWNYPLGMAIMKLAPALAAGCTVVLKPDEHTPLSALYLAELIRRVGFPPGVVNIAPGVGDVAGAALVEHAGVDKIAFTGSTETGRSIVRAAAGNLKRVSLELGGKSPFIVFPDCDLDRAISAAAYLGFFLQGQNCQCPSRMYVHDDVFERFLGEVTRAAESMRIGPGMDPETRLGPLISARQLERVREYVDAGHADGATLVTGGGAPDGPGFYFAPTIFTDTHRDMRIVREEIFGPVICVQPFSDTSVDAVAGLANDTRYGLVASVWTRDLGIATELSERIEAGVVGVNHHGAGDVYAPFGGYKESGWGREFGAENLDLYLETKTVVVRS